MDASATISAIRQKIDPYIGEKLFIGLDRDGTLVPYAETPEAAKVDAELHDLIADLASTEGIYVAIVSARSMAQLHNDFTGKRLILAGNYGLEIALPGRELFIQPEALNAVPDLKKARDELASLSLSKIGAIIEDHGYSLCIHWHKVLVERRSIVHDALSSLSGSFPQLEFLRLPTSYEIKPAVPWSKGLALDYIFEQYLNELKSAHIIYAGDSPADESAFVWANNRGGLSIKVGTLEFDSCAQFHLSDLQDLRLFLRTLLQSRQDLQHQNARSV